jgi:hypothetical protein
MDQSNKPAKPVIHYFDEPRAVRPPFSRCIIELLFGGFLATFGAALLYGSIRIFGQAMHGEQGIERLAWVVVFTFAGLIFALGGVVTLVSAFETLCGHGQRDDRWWRRLIHFLERRWFTGE